MEKYLPLGSVVILKDGEKTIMIYGRKQTHEDTNVEYDYVACLYPEGHINEEFIYLFDHERIDKVIFTGYSDESDKEVVKWLNESQEQGK